MIGCTIAYIGNRDGDRGAGGTLQLVLSGLLLGALALIGLAFEGIICLIIASPLIVAIGWLGGVIGREIAVRRRSPSATPALSIALLPLLMFAETALPPKAGFDHTASVIVAAPPAAVWDAVVHMGRSPMRRPRRSVGGWPIRWAGAFSDRAWARSGRGVLDRSGLRAGTRWEPGRGLDFIVLSDPPTMRELSPYSHVDAPHNIGYSARSTRASRSSRWVAARRGFRSPRATHSISNPQFTGCRSPGGRRG